VINANIRRDGESLLNILKILVDDHGGYKDYSGIIFADVVIWNIEGRKRFLVFREEILIQNKFHN
jgi:hypothetical protein